jgi:hypothetical protein
VLGEEGVDYGVVLRSGDRAGGVHQCSAGTDVGGGGGEETSLQRRERGDVRGLTAPAELGMLAQRAKAGAWRVDEHGVEACVVRERQLGRVGADPRDDRGFAT